jgi:hypothetical protein
MSRIDVSDAIFLREDALDERGPLLLNTSDLRLELPDGSQVDVRMMLHIAKAVDLVRRGADRKTVLAVDKGRFRGVQSRGFHWFECTADHSFHPTVVEAAECAAKLRQKRPRPSRPGGDDGLGHPIKAARADDATKRNEVVFSHEVTRAERDALGRAAAVALDDDA